MKVIENKQEQKNFLVKFAFNKIFDGMYKFFRKLAFPQNIFDYNH